MTKELDLKLIVSLIRKKLWIVLVIGVIGTAAIGAYSTWFTKPVYQAYTKLIVNSPVAKAGGFQLDLNMINTNLSLINTYKEIIKTPSIMSLVVEKHPDIDVSPEQLMKGIRFSSVNGTQVVTLYYQDTDYKRAAKIVNSVSQVFQLQIPKIMKVDNVYLLDMADADKMPSPVKPDIALNMAIGAVVSVLLGIGLVLLLDYFDDSIRTEDDVQHYLMLPALVSVPYMKQGDITPKQRSQPPQEKDTKAGVARVS
ncbi:capsular polysaccharide biosynthesis protein [Paenibacillus cellulosilyticus]|uniref:Capsular polysaccharide biosynthesis protein n=2 Tax=Paenibacillus cellulosilyticus TaxID=375489 RepID=A0A2V2YZH8_9BACL|nr:Wzz/FepE/Etk N-terminal domain-containing protein [Paenibacillus cellulosilyticus]PWW07550.1 capsular polysaccharide biosynthesis protein [Paenibacillus cellulosilyticus]